MEYIPYTYLIGWAKLNKWYYGVEYSVVSKIANPENLWTVYFTSSKEVKKFREQNGEPDVLQIRKTFTAAEGARLWEEKVLKRLNVIEDDKWLNKNDNRLPVLWGHTHNKGRIPSEEIIEKRRASMVKTMAEKFPIENRNIRSEFGSEEYHAKISNGVKKYWSNLSEEKRTILGSKISNSLIGTQNRLGQTNSEEHRRRASASIKEAFIKDPSKTSKGTFWWNNGSLNKKSKECPGEEWIRGKLPHNKSYNSERMKEIWALRKAGKLPMPDYS